MKEKQNQPDVILAMAELVRQNSSDGKLTKASDFTQEPISLKPVEVEAKLEELKQSEECQDIVFIQGDSEEYLYSRRKMTESYAVLLARIEDGNLLSLIGKTVRDESRIYPRTTSVELFSQSPFRLTEEQIEGLLKELRNHTEFSDIQEVRASNGALYLYSDRYLNADHAAALTEWIEVIQEEIP